MMLSQDTVIVVAGAAVKPVASPRMSTSRCCCCCGLQTFLLLFLTWTETEPIPLLLRIGGEPRVVGAGGDFPLGLRSLAVASRPLPGETWREMELLFHFAGSGGWAEK